MAKNFLKIRESVSFSLMDPALTRIKDDYEGAFKPPNPNVITHPSGMGTVPDNQQQNTRQVSDGLLVRLAATHAGIITRNNGFYLPDKMRKGVKTFTDHYPKPILLHHGEKQDAVGRAVEAAYMDTSGAALTQFDGYEIKNKEGKILGVINERLINDFTQEKMPFGQQVDVVRNVFRDSSLLEDSAYEGLGHIQLVAKITDQEAVQKLLDGRYLTGSVGASTDKAVCSVCKSDWTDSGPCDHKPGGIYDDAKCFIIAGNLSYDEYSFVNTPADRHSKVLELNYNGNKTVVDSAEDYRGRIYEVNLGFPQYDSVNKEDISMEGNTQKVQDAASSNTPETDKGSVQVVDGNTQDNTDPNQNVTDDTTSNTDNGDQAPEGEGAEETIEDFVVRVLESDESLSTDDEEKLYDALWSEAEAAHEAGEWTLVQAGVEKLEDAKLSTEKRKKLPKSSFCGPNRSFPVPDCAHVTAARRLVGRAKVGDSTKSKIMACVNRKAKAMGCDTQDSVPTTQDTDTAQNKKTDNLNHSRMLRNLLSVLDEDVYFTSEPVLEDEEVTMLQTAIQRLAKMVGKDSLTKAVVAEDLAIDPECEQQLLDQIEKQEVTMGDLRDSLQATRKEYTALFQDMETTQDHLVEVQGKFRKLKEKYLSTVVALRDQKVPEESFSELSDADLDNRIENTNKEVDITKITDKLGNGMSREPQDTLDSDDSYNTIQDSHNSNDQQISADTLQQIQEQYLYLRLGKGEAVAEDFLNRMKQEGLLPQDDE